MKPARPITKQQLQELRDAIRKVYVEVWDPLRLMDDPDWPRDEYDRYIDPVASFLLKNGTGQQIVEQLDRAVECMGMDGSRLSLQSVVAALRAIPIGVSGKP